MAPSSKSPRPASASIVRPKRGRVDGSARHGTGLQRLVAEEIDRYNRLTDAEIRNEPPMSTRLLLFSACLLGISPGLPAQEEQAAATSNPLRVTDADLRQARSPQATRDILPILRRYCTGCHGPETSEGGLQLETALNRKPLVRDRDTWNNIAFLVGHRFMPPEDEEQPDDATRRRLVAWIRVQVDEFDYSTINNPGDVPIRRLTHHEYDNTVRDLFGVDVRPASQFPSELSGTSGFDNSANTLFLQPILMERYLGAAEKVLNAALPLEPQTEAQKTAVARILFVRPGGDISDREAASRILDRFLPRAFRRPVPASTRERYVSAVLARRRSGSGFNLAIREILQAALVSPSFLMKSETPLAGDGPTAISDHDLASRLSYFLWATMPDERLTQLADQGTLDQPDMLDAEITRMLADPRAETLGTRFAGQWLGSVHLGTRIRADPIDNPWCTETLMTAMRAETAMFFVSLVRDNQPISRLIDARYTFLNQELAKFYRIGNVRGPKMRRVELKTDQRGGLIGQASLLTVTSFPGRTSPINRGRWILADLLGTPPPPPPPGASELSEELAERSRLSRRQKLELHRKDRRCAACHDAIDPLGLSLENYDWFGRWRTRRRRRTVDASASLPEGHKFSGPAGLRRILLARRHEQLVNQVIRKMLAYSLGRQLEYYDETAVRAIRKTMAANEFRFGTLIRAITRSYPFRNRQRQPDRPSS